MSRFLKEFRLEVGKEIVTGNIWEARDSKAAILALHGLCSDSRVFNNFAKLLREEGYTVLAIDIKGYKRKDFREKTLLRKNILDIHYSLKYLQEEFHENKVILMGHSLGSGYVLLYRWLANPNIDGIILLAPPVRILPKIDRKISMYVTLYFIKSLFTRKKKINIEKFFPKSCFMKSRYGREVFYTLRECRIQTFDKLLKMNILIGAPLLIYALRIREPTMIVQGTRDELLDYRGAYDLYDAIRFHKKELLLVKGGTHNLNGLLSETSSKKAIKVAYKIIEWIKSVIT